MKVFWMGRGGRRGRRRGRVLEVEGVRREGMGQGDPELHCGTLQLFSISRSVVELRSSIARLLPLFGGEEHELPFHPMRQLCHGIPTIKAVQDWPFRIVLSLIYLSQSSLTPLELSTSVILLGPRTSPVTKTRRRKMLTLATAGMTACWRKLTMFQIMHK